jgi:cyclophilin family peptidyl-prolyl cis-trans isomerase
MHGEQALPPNYVIFGNVVDGLETLDAIATAEVTMSASGEPSKPVAPAKIKNVTITEQ